MIVMLLNSYKLVSETHAIMWPKIMHLENHLISVQVLQNSWNLKCVYFDRKFTSICFLVVIFLASLVAQRIKRLPAMQETRVRSLGWEDPLEKEMTTHSSILAWRDWGAWRATVHRVAKSWTRLSYFTYIKGKSFIGFPIGFNFKWKSNHYSQQTWVDPIAFNGFSSGTLSHLV